MLLYDSAVIYNIKFETVRILHCTQAMMQISDFITSMCQNMNAEGVKTSTGMLAFTSFSYHFQFQKCEREIIVFKKLMHLHKIRSRMVLEELCEHFVRFLISKRQWILSMQNLTVEVTNPCHRGSEKSMSFFLQQLPSTS